MDYELFIEELAEENARLKQEIALGRMDDSDRSLAEEIYREQRDTIRTLTIQVEALIKTRDQLQLENSKLRAQVKRLSVRQK